MICQYVGWGGSCILLCVYNSTFESMLFGDVLVVVGKIVCANPCECIISVVVVSTVFCALFLVAVYFFHIPNRIDGIVYFFQLIGGQYISYFVCSIIWYQWDLESMIIIAVVVRSDF